MEKVVKYKKNDHVLYLYDNYEKSTIIPKTDKIRLFKSKEIFKDNISKKYDYYEYIYKNIPIIRVIIDITSRLIVGNGGSFKYVGDDEVPDTSMMEFLDNWLEEELPNELIRFQTKQYLLYGKSYLRIYVINKGRKKYITFKSIHPKSIRPIHENNQIKKYEIIDEKGKRQVIKKDQILEYSPSKNHSFVEKYIYLLDIIYPKITNKEKRPKLLYDTLFGNLKTSSLMENYVKSEKMLLAALEIAKNLDNNVCIVVILSTLGDLNRKYNHYIKALEHYEQAQEYLGTKVHSTVMEKLETDLINKILEIQKLL